jgi:hypothetical protein
MEIVNTVAAIDRFLTHLPVRTPSPLTLARSLNECWFSNTLAWLLDPRGSHGFGPRFVEAFARRIGRCRSKEDGTIHYRRRGAYLKHGRAGTGEGATGFRFVNGSVVREFYLSKAVGRDPRGPRYSDLVFFDLDSADSFFLVIENKPFLMPNPEQLRCYRREAEKRYARVAVREYVLLTLRHDAPWASGGPVDREARDWVRLSWTGDILELLGECQPVGTEARRAVVSLMTLLRWADCVTDLKQFPVEPREAFGDELVRAVADCLYEELSRLHEDRGGHWELKDPGGATVSIRHSTQGVSRLEVSRLPRLSVAIHGHAHGRPAFEKIIVPFGAHPDQVFNLVDLAAREIYWKHFKTPGDHIGDARKRPVTQGTAERRHEGLFRLAYRRPHALRLLVHQGQLRTGGHSSVGLD